MTEEPQEEKSFFNIIVHSFFIIPFLIAVFCVLLFASMHLLTRENRTVYDYLEDVKTGGLTKRWQGAFELSKILANPDLLPEEDRFYNELINAFEKSDHDDNRVRQYLALAMGRTGREEFAKPLLNALNSAESQNKTAIIYALGMLQNDEAVDALTKNLTDQDPKVRSITTVALGTIGDKKTIGPLRKILSDKEPNVQWGAAISLAHLGDDSGQKILEKLLDRGYLNQFDNVDPDEKTNLMISAIEASKNIRNKELTNTIKEISQSDKNMKVRSAAFEYLKNCLVSKICG